jgi:hypothetical protein
MRYVARWKHVLELPQGICLADTSQLLGSYLWCAIAAAVLLRSSKNCAAVKQQVLLAACPSRAACFTKNLSVPSAQSTYALR